MVPRRQGSLQGKAPVKPEDLAMGEKCPQECQLTWDQLKGRTWPVLLAPGQRRPATQSPAMRTAPCEGRARSSCSPPVLRSPMGACPCHTHRPQPPVTLLSPTLPAGGEATHLSLARAGVLSWVCGSAGQGAAAWSTKPLPLGTAPPAGPLSGISKTVPPSSGALRHQRASRGPAHRRSTAN